MSLSYANIAPPPRLEHGSSPRYSWSHRFPSTIDIGLAAASICCAGLSVLAMFRGGLGLPPVLLAGDDLFDRGRTIFCGEPETLNLKGDECCVSSVTTLANPSERSVVFILIEAVVAMLPLPEKTDSGITGTGRRKEDSGTAAAAEAAKNGTCGKLTLSDE